MNIYTVCSSKYKDEVSNLFASISTDNYMFNKHEFSRIRYANRQNVNDVFIPDVVIIFIDDSLSSDKLYEFDVKTAVRTSIMNKIRIILILLDQSSAPKEIASYPSIAISGDFSSGGSTEILKTKLSEILSTIKVKRNRSLKSNFTKQFYMMAISFSLFFVILLTSDMFKFPSTFPQLRYITLVFFLSFMVVFTLLYIKTSSQDHETMSSDKYYQRLQSAIITSANDQPTKKNKTNETKQTVDALELMLINLDDIKEFYSWSQKQAKRAFRLAVWMCILGFLLMCSAVIIQLITKADNIALYAALSGAVTELIAGSTLIVYKHSITQLNHYHKALHEDERFLVSVNLLNRFSTNEIQDEILKEIIRSEIEMNLIAYKCDNSKLKKLQQDNKE